MAKGANKSGKKQKGQKKQAKAQQSKSVSVPAAKGRVVRNTTKQKFTTESGTDYVRSVTVDSAVQDGVVLADINLSPLQFEGTHLHSLGAAFEQYRFTKLEVDVVCKAPSTTAGGYLAGITPDVRQELGTGLNAKRYVRALTGSVTANWWISTTVRFNTAGASWRYVNEDDTEAYMVDQGKFLLVVDGPPNSLVGSLEVSLILRWTCQFKSPTAHQGLPFALKPIELPEGTKFSIRVHDGEKSGAWWYWPAELSEQWSQMKWSMIYSLHPSHANVGDGKKTVNFLQISDNPQAASGVKAVALFSSLEEAQKIDFYKQAQSSADVGGDIIIKKDNKLPQDKTPTEFTIKKTVLGLVGPPIKPGTSTLVTDKQLHAEIQNLRTDLGYALNQILYFSKLSADNLREVTHTVGLDSSSLRVSGQGRDFGHPVWVIPEVPIPPEETEQTKESAPGSSKEVKQEPRSLAPSPDDFDKLDGDSDEVKPEKSNCVEDYAPMVLNVVDGKLVSPTIPRVDNQEETEKERKELEKRLKSEFQDGDFTSPICQSFSEMVIRHDLEHPTFYRTDSETGVRAPVLTFKARRDSERVYHFDRRLYQDGVINVRENKKGKYLRYEFPGHNEDYYYIVHSLNDPCLSPWSVKDIKERLEDAESYPLMKPGYEKLKHPIRTHTHRFPACDLKSGSCPIPLGQHEEVELD